MKYAVQVRWPEGHWTYVMKPWSMEEREIFDERADAESMAETWRKPGREDAVRVVEEN